MPISPGILKRVNASADELFADLANLSPADWLAAWEACLRAEAVIDPLPLKRHLRQRWEQLGAEENHQQRGFSLERVLLQLLALERLEPAPSSYVPPPESVGERPTGAPVRRGRRPGGEQIDGYFKLDGWHFLLEAKWEKHAVPVSKLYEFRGRVEGKLQGTLGLFLSLSGFADGADYVLLSGRELTVILANQEDLDAALMPDNSFREMMQVKLREAARRGVAWWPYKTFLDGRKV